jgi:hypothetical protein
MGTNYYRIPTTEEMESKKQILIQETIDLDLSPSMIERNFKNVKENSWDLEDPWDKFLDGTNIHLGKRSQGWKFCWNFHKQKYYSNKEELLKFIRLGRVVNEYGEEQNVEQFIEMALNWCEPNGLIVNEEYRRNERIKGNSSFWLDNDKYDDLIIDGLRVSKSIDFS